MINEKSGTINGALVYIKNELPAEQAAPLRSAMTTVLRAVYGQGWRQINVRDINVQQSMDEFAKLAGKEYSEASLIAYKSRITRAIRIYSDALKNEDPSKIPAIKNVSQIEKTNELRNEAMHRSQIRERDPRAFFRWGPGDQELITYPFPLTTGQIVRLHLPAKLSKEDAKRLSIFIDTIAINDTEVERK